MNKTLALLRLTPKQIAIIAVGVTLLGAALLGVRATFASDCPCTVFTPTSTPALTNLQDGQPLELGMKFRSDVAGDITAIRFYKGDADTGSHIGSLWASDGTKLAEITFSNETSSGWQQAELSTPVPIQPDTTYVVSYYSVSGYYTADNNYFTTNIDNPPLHGLASGVDGTNGLYKYGASGFPTNSWNASNYWVDVVFEDTPADSTPPTIVSNTPAAGAQNVAIGVNPSVKADEELDLSSANETSVTLTSGGSTVAATVTYLSADSLISIDPASDLSYATDYTVTIKGGSTGIKDLAGNPLATDYTWSFTTISELLSGCPCSIWGASETPVGGTYNDSQGIELGVKFQSEVGGLITGVKYYRAPGAAGAYTGNLWSSGGVLLASAVIADNGLGGWQTASFVNSVPIEANTTYVASYFTSSGIYFATGGYFGVAKDNPPLHGLASAAAGGNGVFSYGATSTFPVNSYNNGNYWADVVFSAEGVADTVPPVVSGTVPASNATGVSTSVAISAAFSESLDSSTVNGSSVSLRNSESSTVASAVTYDSAARSIVITPQSPLERNSTYSVTILGGASGVKDTSGNPLEADYAWSFTTTNSLPLDQGFGGPILILTDQSNKFSTYYAEILRAEGFNSFATADVSTISAISLQDYEVVVLGEAALSDAQVTILSDWVNAGGNLIAMRPDSKLASLSGITFTGQTLNDAYLQIDTSQGPGAGIVGETIQYHGTADRYDPSGATSVAMLFSDAVSSTSNPAVTLRSVGTGGGQVAVFAYDLARSVVYSHQGNPAWAGDERDGSSPIRPNDLFYGAKAGDVQPDYVDLNKVAIPQADEQQRLLANIITEVTSDSMPIAKWWYLPNGKKAAVLMAADDHALGGTVATFDRLRNGENCDVNNWECNRSTSWFYTDTNVTPEQAYFYDSIGFDLGVHVSTSCQNWTESSLSAAFAADLAAFRAKYPNLPPQTGNRTHCIAWSDWATQPKVELSYGIRLDLNYYYWPSSWVQNRGGFFTGSGIPMRFADLDGTMIDVMQVPTHLVNESGLTEQAIADFLDRAVGPEGYYGVFGTHYDYSDGFDVTLQNLANARGITMVSGKQVLDWTDGRNASTMNNYVWDGSTLQFNAETDQRTGAMLRGMLPVTHGAGTLVSVSKDGSPVPLTTEVIKGINYAFFPVTTGAYSATYSNTTPPTVLSTVPTANATGVSANQDITATFSKALDPTTVTASTVVLLDASNATIPTAISYDAGAKKVTVNPDFDLASQAVYTVTIVGGETGIKDAAGLPLAADYVWSFTTASAVSQFTVFTPTSTPALTNLQDGQPLELGMKFRSDVAGDITAIRFYKGDADTGSHIGSLWASDGTKLAEITFSNETSSGWQQAELSTPVPIQPDTTYVVSYYSVSGYYTADNNYFTTNIDKPPLHGLASGVDGTNGLYKYGASGFPTNSWNASNYWVDVVFESQP